jgi:hypothetical protein
MMQKYWQELVDIWPELKPYVDQIHVVYAGLSPGESVLNQSEHLIKQEVEHALQQRKRVLFYGVEEGFIKPVLYKIQSVVESINFEPYQLVFTTSAVNGQEIYNELVKEEQWQRPMTIASGYYFERTNFHASLMDIPDYSIDKKKKLFTCFNRAPRPHRVALLAEMYKNQLVDRAYYSFEGSFNSTKLPIWGEEKKLLEPYKHLLPLHLDIDEDTINPAGFTDQDLSYHTNSYFSVVTETNFNFLSLAQSSIFVSEKTFRPILYQQPFILVSRPGTLQALRNAGYKTFSPWIDESYDQIEDDHARLKAIVKEILLLAKFTNQDWADWQDRVQHVVKHNYLTFKNKTDFSITKGLAHLLKLA